MSVTGPRGFVASGVAAGIKDSGALDLALVATATRRPVAAAASFTTNLSAAAPVRLSRAHLVATAGHAAAVLLNSGCANAATGDEGSDAAQRSAAAAARALGVDTEAVLVCSTGLIGRRLAVERIEAAMPDLVGRLGAAGSDASRAASAILTTDTHAKQVLVDQGGIAVGGMAKGAGMIAPNMATMLVVLTSDVATSPEVLARALRRAVDTTFNELSVDGCTSTNDTVTLLASGLGPEAGEDELSDLLSAACADLSVQLAADAEGTTKVVRYVVRGAVSSEDARRAARRVGESLLVKTSLYGADPYWGRVLSELGSSGAAFDLERASVAYGGVVVCSAGRGVRLSAEDEARVAAHMAGRTIEIECDLGLGQEEATLIGTDLGHGYVEENMRTS